MRRELRTALRHLEILILVPDDVRKRVELPTFHHELVGLHRKKSVRSLIPGGGRAFLQVSVAHVVVCASVDAILSWLAGVANTLAPGPPAASCSHKANCGFSILRSANPLAQGLQITIVADDSRTAIKMSERTKRIVVGVIKATLNTLPETKWF